MPKKLILFDIDRTLLEGGSRVHADAFSYAFQKIYKINTGIDEIGYIGKTDTRIIIEVLEKMGLSRDIIISHLSEACKAMEEYFRKNINSQNQKICLGVENLLSELKERGRILGLVSGNLEEIGKLKLKKAGILKFFEIGEFGEVSEIRAELVKEAIRQAEEKYGKIRNNDIFVVGDSPYDIECGKANKVKTITVATGVHSREELAKFKPDHLFDDFKNFQDVVNCIEK